MTEPRTHGSIDLSSYTYGKIPPAARDLEEAVLGAILSESDAIFPILSLLIPESFYVIAHQHIFRAMTELFNRGNKIDLLTVTDQLKKNGRLEEVGGPFFISELIKGIASAANIEDHARIIYQCWLKREQIRISSEMIREAYEDSSDAFDLIHKAEVQLMKLSSGPYVRVQHVSIPVKSNIEQSDHMAANPHQLSGIPTGLSQVDAIMLGLEKTDLTIAAARPGMGKTSLILSIAKTVSVTHKKSVAVFSLEMATAKITLRLQSQMSGVDSEMIRTGKMNPYERQSFMEASELLADAPLYFDDAASLNIIDFRARAARMKMEYGIELFIVDYLQLMSGLREKNSNREQEISSISRGLKQVAKELDVPVIAASQLSRAVEQRGGDKRPNLSDLRESGAIEQDADNVWFIYRPEYYGIEVDDSNNSTRGIAEIIIAKHRNGKTGTAFQTYEARLTKFGNLHADETPY